MKDTLNHYTYAYIHTELTFFLKNSVAPSSAHKARQFHHAPEPPISSPESPFNKDHPPASSPSTTFYKHHHTRNTVTSPAPASSHSISPSTSKHQGLVY